MGDTGIFTTGTFTTGIFTLQPGRVVGLEGAAGSGLTRLGLEMLVPASRLAPVAVLDVRGWFCPLAAWENGLAPDRLVVVRCRDRMLWPQVAAALSDGLAAVYAEVPPGVKEPLLRRLVAVVRNRKAALVLRPLQGTLPSGLVHLRLQVREIAWEGTEAGHGRLLRRRLVVEASGKAAGGMTRTYEVDDDGADALRVVSGLVAAPLRRAAG